jgi:hypothetical protein
MLKMLSLALIAAGLAFHHVFLDFLTEYLDGARLTYWNEKWPNSATLRLY